MSELTGKALKALNKTKGVEFHPKAFTSVAQARTTIMKLKRVSDKQLLEMEIVESTLHRLLGMLKRIKCPAPRFQVSKALLTHRTYVRNFFDEKGYSASWRKTDSGRNYLVLSKR